MDRRYGCRPCPILFILLIALFCLATGCERSEPAGAEQGLELEFDRAELMLIVATERNRYEEVYTDQIWDVVKLIRWLRKLIGFNRANRTRQILFYLKIRLGDLDF